jgi:hypothetical protein
MESKKTFKEELFELVEEFEDFKQELIDHKFYPNEEKFYFKFFDSINCELHVAKYNFKESEDTVDINDDGIFDFDEIEPNYNDDVVVIRFHLGEGFATQTQFFECEYTYDEFKKLDILKLMDKKLKFLNDMYVDCHYALAERKGR